MLQQEEMAKTHRLRISKDGDKFTTPLRAKWTNLRHPCAKCWVTKCPSSGDLSPILGRLKRMSSKRKYCSYLLTLVRSNNVIQNQFPRGWVFIKQWLVNLACTFWYNRAQYLKSKRCSGLMERQKRCVLAVRTCGCCSISFNKFLVLPLVAYLPDEAFRIYSESVPGY